MHSLQISSVHSSDASGVELSHSGGGGGDVSQGRHQKIERQRKPSTL
jgi:hypothetical protein